MLYKKGCYGIITAFLLSNQSQKQKNVSIMKKHILLLCVLCYSMHSYSQVEKNSELYKTLKTNDSLLFEVGFNTCQYAPFENLLAEDIEFYHDLGGITNSKRTFINFIKNGLCKSDAYRSRRALIARSLEVFPLYKNDTLYGAIQKGEHRFFEMPKGEPERAASFAKFTHLWIKEGEVFKLKRALSYDHLMKKP
jgi:hypothetical protein